MDDTASGLRPARRQLAKGERLSRLEHALVGLADAAAQLAPSAVADDPIAQGAALLRQRLAVRGWVSPLDAMRSIAPALQDGVLRAVASDVELATQARPGLWFMTTAARRRVLAGTGSEVLQRESQPLFDADAHDPMRLAVRVVLGLDTTPVAALPPDILQELTRLAAWREPRALAIDGNAGESSRIDRLTAAAAAQLQRLRRQEELDRAAIAAIFGRDAERERILAFLASAPVRGPVRTLYVHGVGGSGKSTLLLAAEAALRQDSPARAVRLDFDSPYLDPMNPERMDVLLLRQLAGEAPEFAENLRQRMELLQSLSEKRVQVRIEAAGRVDTTPSGKTVRRVTKKARRAVDAPHAARAAEASGISEGYERISALSGIGDMPFMAGRPLVLFLDTMENVSRLGPAAVDSVLDWVASLRVCASGGDLRVVLAGRDALGSDTMAGLADRFEVHELRCETGSEVALGDLALGAAVELLASRGMPAPAAQLAAAALPRNPLVLRLAADTYVRNPAEVSDIQQAYQQGRIDRLTAAGYLAQRVVAHVPRQPARRYAVAAMVLPLVTERQLRDIVILAVDGEADDHRGPLARQVYAGLREASWLTTEEQPGTLRWHTELRRLVLPMISADPAHAGTSDRVRAAAIVWHERQRSAAQRAYAVYYRLMAGGQPLDAEARQLAVNHFPRFLADLPQDAGDALPATTGSVAATTDAAVHRMRLEGVGGRGGEGDRLVTQGRGRRAIELYRERPTREPGAPPTFVIRALADTAQWDTGEVRPEAVLDELRADMARRKSGIGRSTVDRLYWLTRFELLRACRLCTSHEALLRDACARLAFNAQNGALMGLVATAEALQASAAPRRGTGAPPTLDFIAPGAWPPPNARVGAEIRFSMVRTVYGAITAKQQRRIRTTLDALLVMDRGWQAAMTQLSVDEVFGFDGGAATAARLGEQMRRLEDATLAEVEQFIATCRETAVDVDLARTPPPLAAWLMRGTTLEFHRPLASAIAAAIVPQDVPRGPTQEDRRVALEQLVRFVAQLRTRPHEAILPLAEFRSAQRIEAHARSLESAVLALVVTLDRANALGAFCREFRDLPTNAPWKGSGLTRVFDLCDRFLQWDRALDPLTPTRPASQQAAVSRPRSTEALRLPDAPTRRSSMSTQLETLARLRRFNAWVRTSDPKLTEETADVVGGVALEAAQPSPEAAGQAVDLESIVLRRTRPVLAIKENEAQLVFVDQADSAIWSERIAAAKPFLDDAIRAIGRIDLAGGRLDWVGTGWLVHDNVLVTNRHVAAEFARSKGFNFTFRMGSSGPMQASVDFLQEIDNPHTLAFRLLRPLHIQPAPGPDVAFFEVEPISGDERLRKPIRLAATPGESDGVATIGYPAYDSRIPEPELMETIFGRVYDKKRLAPGAVTQIDETRLLHNCTTLGGNSGSVVIDLASGEALGLHFSGSFLAANYAVRADVVRKLLDSVLTRRSAAQPRSDAAPTAPSKVVPAEISAEETEAVAADYRDRGGYSPDFLGSDFEVPLPTIERVAPDVLSFEVDGQPETELRYEHYSVVMSRSRRMCLLSACNIDGKQSKKSKRVGWKWDPRVPKTQQIMHECYGDPPRFSRGHMTRREDPGWGNVATAKRGNEDSMHVTNTTPQMQAFNSPIWLALEDYALDHAREDQMKISVFTGPYFTEEDPVMYGVRIPLAFWKLIAFIHDETGKLCATGYEMNQEQSLQPEEEFVFGAFTSPQLGITTQVPIKSIEAKSGILFGPLAALDPLTGGEEAVEGAQPLLESLDQIRFLR